MIYCDQFFNLPVEFIKGLRLSKDQARGVSDKGYGQ